jgi:hypothetical protein
MNWEAVGAIGELVGALAVVITLAYLALQIRYTHRIAADTNRRFRASGVMDGMKLLLSDEGLRKSWSKAIHLEEIYDDLGAKLNLSRDEATKFDYFFLYWVWLHWGQYMSVTTEEDLDEIKHLIANFYSMEALQVCLRNSPFRDTLDEKFVSFIEEVVAQHNSAP